VSIGLADGTGIVRAVSLKGAATARSVQSGAKKVDLNMLMMLTVLEIGEMVILIGLVGLGPASSFLTDYEAGLAQAA